MTTYLRHIFICSLYLSLSTMNAANADVKSEQQDDVFALPPEEFFSLDLDVVSPAKKIQKLRNVPAAVYVLTGEDIKRSAVTNFPDLLRLVPGIQVAQAGSHDWAITARGFNQEFANNLLLLIDGTPLDAVTFNGVFWENVNIPLDLIERIEIVRGPGATIWGTRAVNGVINVIMKDAFSFPQSQVTLGAGSEHQVSAYGRAGRVITRDAAIQAYVKFDQHGSTERQNGGFNDDKWSILSGSVRGDFGLSRRDSLQIVSRFSGAQENFELNVPTLVVPFSESINDDRKHYHGSLAFLWDRKVSSTSDINVELTTYMEDREDELLDYSAYNIDSEFRHRFQLLSGNDFTYGANFRFYSDDIKGSDTISFDDESRTLAFYRGFLHDEIDLIKERLVLTIGSRFEENKQVGFSVLPTTRLILNATDDLSVWGGISYTVGTPSRVNDDLRLNATSFPDPGTGLPTMVQIVGNRDVDSENLLAYEVGLWVEPIEKVYLSATGYLFYYGDVITRELGQPRVELDAETSAPFVQVPLVYSNGLEANSGGLELAIDWNISDRVSLSGAYTFMDLDASQGDSQDLIAVNFVEDVPTHSCAVRGHVDLSEAWETDLVVRYMDELPRSSIDEYLQADAQAKWFITPSFALSLIGRNLLGGSHEEFRTITFNTPVSEVERSLFLGLTYTN